MQTDLFASLYMPKLIGRIDYKIDPTPNHNPQEYNYYHSLHHCLHHLQPNPQWLQRPKYLKLYCLLKIHYWLDHPYCKVRQLSNNQQ